MAETFTVHNPTGPDLEFEGELLGEASDGHVGTMKVFRTLAGKLIAQHTKNPMYGTGAPNFERVGVFESHDELAQWLGYSLPAKELLEKIGHPLRIKVD